MELCIIMCICIYIYIKYYVVIPISVMNLYCETCSKIIEYPVNGGRGPLLWEVFSPIQFFQEEFYPPWYTFLWVKLDHLL